MSPETTKLKRVLLVAPRLEARGTSEYSVNLARELSGLGVEVEVCCAPGPMLAMLDGRGIRLRTFAHLERFGLHVGERRSFQGAVAQFAPQIVHAQSVRVAAALKGLDGLDGAPLVLTVHWVPPECGKLRRLARRFNGIIAPTQTVREELVNDCHVARDRVRVIPNGIDVSDLASRCASPIFSSPVPAVGSLGPIEQDRGHELFVRAAALVARNWPAVQFVVAGEGEGLPKLRKLVASLGLERTVTLARDFTSYQEVLDALDVVVQSSQVDVSGYSILEAMGRGRPVIAFNTGTACEIIEDRETGLLIPKGDVPALAAAIEGLISNPATARQMGENARMAVREKFDVRTLALQTLQYYAGLLAD